MAHEPNTDVDAAVRFFEWKRPGGPWALIAPTPDWDRGSPLTWLRTTEELRRYIVEKSGRFGVFYPVAEVVLELGRQPKKSHLIETQLLHVDLDPPPGMAPECFDEWVHAKVEEVRLQTHSPRPSCIIMSGNGLHLLWALREPHPLNGADETIAYFEAYTNGLALAFGANDGTWNANRVLRAPGTINLPNAKKRKDGRTARPSSIVELHPDRVFSLGDFHAVHVTKKGQEKPKGSPGHAAAPERGQLCRMVNTDELARWCIPSWIRDVIVEGTDPSDPNRWGGDRSAAQWAVTSELARRGVPMELIVGILTDKTWGIAAHVLDQKDPLGYAWRQAEKAHMEAKAVDHNPGRGRVLDPAAPFATATQLRAELFPTAIHSNDDFLEYHRGAYRVIEDATMRSAVWKALDAALVEKIKGDRVEVAPFKPAPPQVSAVLDALKGVTHQPADRMAPPVWLDGDGPPPSEIVPLRNGLLHVPTGELLPPTPRFFTRNALCLDFDADAPPPVEWLRFVGQVFPDPAAAALLQEWLGYLLLPDLSQQKIMLLVGPPRSGKGVIQHVITALVGPSSVCAPSSNSLAGNNVGALQPLIGATVAFLPDARFGGRADKVAITASLLAISGGDRITIDRKYKKAWNGQLAARLVIMSNELPGLRDNSPALANRFTPLILERSFLGQEDHGLASRIIANEMPGVLLWAVEGWRRLRERGRFALPVASEEAIAEILDLGSPVAAFVNARCHLGEGKSVEKERLYRAYRNWCESTQQHAVALNVFSRDLGTATGGKVRPAKTRVGAPEGGKLTVFIGVDLCDEIKPDERELGRAEMPF